MIASLQNIISQHNLILEPKDPFVVTVSDASEGIILAKDILYQLSDKKTLLLLSGGKTPKAFYENLAKEEKLETGAVGLIDERYGPKMHLDSNEWMIQKTGLLGYLKYQKIPFYPMLQPVIPALPAGRQATEPESRGIKDTASQYDETLRFLFNGFQKSIGILGIGLDGHTAGIPAKVQPLLRLHLNKHTYVTCCDNFPGDFSKRISMTFLGLSMLDIMLVLVFGEDKRSALQAMFAQGNEEEIPARFFKRPEIAQKTLLITDQIL